MTQTEKKTLECSSRGDRRFCSFYARITINGTEDTIEHFYQKAKRRRNGQSAAKDGCKYDHFICPFTGKKFYHRDAPYFYRGLWITYLKRNPDLIEYAKTFDVFTDMFRDKNDPDCQQADIIAAYVKDNEAFMANVRKSRWYKNMEAFYKAASSRQTEPQAPSRPAASTAPVPHAAEPQPQPIVQQPTGTIPTWLYHCANELQTTPVAKKSEEDLVLPPDPYAPIMAQLSLDEVIELAEEGSIHLKDIEEKLKTLLGVLHCREQ